MNADIPLHNQNDLISLAQLCKSTGDPLRLEIVRALKTDSFGVLELSEIFEIKQPTMSHHLKVLAKTNVLTTRREGNSIFYRRALADEKQIHGQLLTTLFQAIDQTSLPNSTQSRIANIKQEREELARVFFDRHANQFQEQQEMIASFTQYEQSVMDLLQQTTLLPSQSALEIGPGAGELLPALSQLFQHITAIDISSEMLEKADKVRTKHQLNNITLIHADTEVAIKQRIKVDRIVCNMVLHHVPSPSDVFGHCAKLLHHNGSLIVTDLCRHDQDWAKSNCGDLWLGFDPEELTDWAEEAGLVSKDSLYLGLRNGFQIQVRRFDKLISP